MEEGDAFLRCVPQLALGTNSKKPRKKASTEDNYKLFSFRLFSRSNCSGGWWRHVRHRRVHVLAASNRAAVLHLERIDALVHAVASIPFGQRIAGDGELFALLVHVLMSLEFTYG